MTSAWETIENGVFLFRDSCLVYAVRGPAGTVFVNAGTGRAADHLGELGDDAGPFTVLLTHHFRDHSDGARRLHDQAGATVFANYWDALYYVDPEQHFRERQTWNSYDNRWDRFAPVRALPVSPDWLMDYETRAIAGLTWEVVPTPGASNGASSYVVTLLNDRRLAFVGETLCGPTGKLGRLAPLQYDYNDLSGARNVWHGCARLLDARPDSLLPSLGEPMNDPPAAVAALQSNLRRLGDLWPGYASHFGSLDDTAGDVEEVSFGNDGAVRLLRSRHAEAQTHFVLSHDRKRVLALDYGYNDTLKMPSVSHRSSRRPLLHGIDGLKQRGIERIDTVLVTHYHDDHVNGVPLLQRLFQSEVWAGDNFADLLERPARYDRPCLWHEPIPVTRKLKMGETVQWDDVAITVYPMSGHTRFSTLVCLEVGGTRIVHTGDQIFWHPWDFPGGVFPADARLVPNHVYKNGLDLGCYQETLAYLHAFRPDWVLTGHTKPYQTNDAWYDAIERGARAFDAVHQALMPLGENDVHFGPESQPAKLKPYRTHVPEAPGESGATLAFDGWALNPFPTRQTATLNLVAPEGWTSAPVTLELGPREQRDFEVTLFVPPGARCRRQPVALDLVIGGRPFGHVTESLVTIGHPYF